MRILLTGANGFIGSHVAKLLLQQRHEVYGIARGNHFPLVEPVRSGQYRSIELDLRDTSSLRAAITEVKPQLAIHLAWYAAPGKFWTAPENLDCVSMSLELAKALASEGCQRFVGAGTCAEYDWSQSHFSETCPLKPSTLYGFCKNSLRSMLEAYCAQSAMEFVWARFFYLYGPGEHEQRLVPSLIAGLLRGKVVECHHGETLRDFLHVADAAAALCSAALSNITGAVNIASGKAIPIRLIAETIANLVRRSSQLKFTNQLTTPDDATVLIADIQKLRNYTGWTPAWTLEEGLRNTIDWWRRRPLTAA